MKVTLEFDSVEDSEALNDALAGTTYRSALDAVWNYLRNEDKHHGKELVDIEDVRDIILETLDGVPL